jgi:hypothetical protein
VNTTNASMPISRAKFDAMVVAAERAACALESAFNAAASARKAYYATNDENSVTAYAALVRADAAHDAAFNAYQAAHAAVIATRNWAPGGR